MTNLSKLSYKELQEFNKAMLQEAEPIILGLCKICSVDGAIQNILKYPNWGAQGIVFFGYQAYLIKIESNWERDSWAFREKYLFIVSDLQDSEMFARAWINTLVAPDSQGLPAEIKIIESFDQKRMAFVRSGAWVQVAKDFIDLYNDKTLKSKSNSENEARLHLLKLMETGKE